MKHYLLTTLAGISMLFLAVPAQALIITPDDCDTTISCETGTQTSESVIRDYIINNYGVEQLYKQDVGGGEEGSLSGSYTTSFFNSGSDPEDAEIVYDGGDTASCPTCLLLVKDGNHSPAWYLFDLSSLWDGMETLYLDGFWPQGGAISHVSLYGTDSTTVAEPQILALLGMGLIGLVVARRKARK